VSSESSIADVLTTGGAGINESSAIVLPAGLGSIASSIVPEERLTTSDTMSARSFPLSFPFALRYVIHRLATNGVRSALTKFF
jgi:hypothetical protein